MTASKIGMATTITGRVQGVYYRESTRKKAEKLGITGWVANHSDGSVRLEAFGTQAQLDKLTRWLHTGPVLARVNSVTSTPISVAEHKHFVVRDKR